MGDCNCSYPMLDCRCCCKEKDVLNGLIARLNGYECYLRTFAVPASCQNLPWSAQLANTGVIIPGGSPIYGLNNLIVGGTLSTIKVWPAIGCNCEFSRVSQAIFKFQSDCWGATPIANGTDRINMAQYLSGKYRVLGGFATAAIEPEIRGLLANESTVTAPQSRFAVVKGAIEYIQEAKRHYHSILSNLPC